MDNADTSLPAVPPSLTTEQTPDTPPTDSSRDVLLKRVAAGAAVPPPLPKMAAKAPLGDPSWWRLNRGIPFIVLLLVAAAADYFCPLLCKGEPYIGFGTAFGSLLFLAAFLLLRKDLSRGENVFLILFGLVAAAAQAFSGSVLSWIAVPVITIFLLLLPKESDTLDEPARTWWGFWLARRPDASKAKAVTSGCLPLCISVAVGLALFFAFLAIFASGNPVVKMAWELICEYWNKMLEFLHLDMTVWMHALVWFIGAVGFGIFTIGRNRIIRHRAPEQQAATGKTLLPHLPSFALTGINAAFAIATSTDIMYLWFRRIPDGISQTEYLHNGAQSIIVAAVLAAGLLLILFRSRGAARQSRVASILGYLLVFQTALLAISVFMRLFFQIDAYGFTGQRVLAGECMLAGVVGIGLLLSYLLGGCFIKHLRVGLATVILLFFGANIQSPSALAGDLNLCFVDTHPHWKFIARDFYHGFDAAGSLAFADRYMLTEDKYEITHLQDATKDIRNRHKGNWRSLTVNALRFRELADAVYARENQKLIDLQEEEGRRREAEQERQKSEMEEKARTDAGREAS